MRGKIGHLRESFGFIIGEDGLSRFFIPSCFTPPVPFNALAVGMEVEFEHEDAPKGPRASNVQLSAVTSKVGS